MPLGCPPADKFKVMTLPLAGLMCRLGPDDPFLGTAVRWIRASSKLAQTEVGLSCGKSDGAELHHQEYPITGIRGPSADAIGMTPAKAERVCIDSPLEGRDSNSQSQARWRPHRHVILNHRTAVG